MTKEPILNPMRERPFADIMESRYSRRDMLGAAGKLGLAAAFAGLLKPAAAQEMLTPQAPMLQPQAAVSSLTFAEISKSTSATHTVAEGYEANLLIRWGDLLTAKAPAFNPLQQSAAAQLEQFGYNNDFLAYMPFPLGSNSSSHGILCANNEYS
jgi:uncharacterized protein